MFKINLEERLVARKGNSIYTKEEQLIIDEANSILEKNLDEDIEVLKKMGLDYSVKEKEVIERKRDYVKGLDKSRIFTEDEIKKLCISYRLKFLPISNYRGSVDPMLPGKINEFDKKYESANGKKLDHYNFMICAPKESFKLEEHPVDPLLFYPIGGGFYYLVHKWGNDISILRWFKAFKMRNFFTWYVAIALQYWAPLAFVGFYFLNLHWGFSFAFAAGSVIQFLIGRYFEGDYSNSWLERRVTSINWNTARMM